MKVLIIGGNGNISWHCTNESLKEGHEVWTLTRGLSTYEHRSLSSEVHQLHADVRNVPSVKKALSNHKFDVVVDFLCYTSGQAHVDVEIFKNKTKHFIFISSTAVYERPSKDIFINESSKLSKLLWDYSYNKVKCEEFFNSAHITNNFPVTIVRPAFTYDTTIPYATGHDKGWTVCQRMIDGKSIVLLGDGTTYWSLTHSKDLSKAIVMLFGRLDTINNTFNIMSDEYLTWTEIYKKISKALNSPPLNIVYVPSTYLLQNLPEIGIHLYNHRKYNDLYDNSKIKLFIPKWKPEILFKDGIKKTIEWFNEDVRRKWINDDLNKFLDGTCAKFGRL